MQTLIITANILLITISIFAIVYTIPRLFKMDFGDLSALAIWIMLFLLYMHIGALYQNVNMLGTNIKFLDSLYPFSYYLDAAIETPVEFLNELIFYDFTGLFASVFTLIFFRLLSRAREWLRRKFSCMNAEAIKSFTSINAGILLVPLT